jgi:hypothetical protein
MRIKISNRKLKKIMKKIITTLSILLSSPISNCFSAGNDNTIIIDDSWIEQFQVIAEDESKPLTERFTACEKLMIHSENTREKVTPIVFNIFQNINSADEEFSDIFEYYPKIFIEYYHDIFVPFFLNLIENTNNEYIKFNILNTMWYNKDIKEIYHNKLIDLLLNFYKDPNNKDYSTEMLSELSRNLHVNPEYYDKLVDICLNVTQNTTKRITRIRFMYELALDPQTLTLHESTLRDLFKQTTQQSSNMMLKLKAYLIFGDYFQEEYNQFMAKCWAQITNDQKQKEYKMLIKRFGNKHPRLLELSLPYWCSEFSNNINAAEAKNKQIEDTPIIQD